EVVAEVGQCLPEFFRCRRVDHHVGIAGHHVFLDGDSRKGLLVLHTDDGRSVSRLEDLSNHSDDDLRLRVVRGDDSLVNVTLREIDDPGYVGIGLDDAVDSHWFLLYLRPRSIRSRVSSTETTAPAIPPAAFIRLIWMRCRLVTRLMACSRVSPGRRNLISAPMKTVSMIINKSGTPVSW